MTSGVEGKDDNKGNVKGKAQTKRNKTTNAFGEKYDKRKGSWTYRDRAIEKEGELLNGWLTMDRYLAELSILNPPGKNGRKHIMTPSFVLYLILLMDNTSLSYRRFMADMRCRLRHLGLPMPSYSTLHKSESRFFGSDYGEEVMKKATEILRSKGIEEDFDPIMLLHSGVCPEFQAPQKIVTSQAEQDEQTKKDEDAAFMRDHMEVTVFKSAVGTEHGITVAIDGSGQTVSGPGAYIEHRWNAHNRGFIKQHCALNIETKEVCAFSITTEKPGDSKMFIPLVKAMTDSGVNLTCVYADMAYDGIDNWKFMIENGIEFHPNLKPKFGFKFELDERNKCLAKETEVGKKEYHRLNGYNDRWLVEAFFSVFKKMYGDRLRAKRFDRMVLRMRSKYCLYNIHRRFMLEAEAAASA